jgi:dienelactone hydrolase
MMKYTTLLVPVLAFAQYAAPERPPAYKPSDAELQQIRTKIAQIHSNDPDVEIFRKAGEWILRFPEEFFTKVSYTNTLRLLDIGIARQAQSERPWAQAKGRIARAYRSRIDGSVQPYGVIVPDSYDPKKPVRLDVILHGRGDTITEVSFLAGHQSDKPIPADQAQIELEVFGRTNNAYRWGGETDVFEAMEAVRKDYHIDPERIVLRGFSMGGAGAWHIGLHYPDQWAAFEAGAGFTETMNYAKLKDVPPYQRAPMHIYDAMDYTLNIFNVPAVGYGGEIDPQLQASRNIQAQIEREGLKPADLRALFLVGPNTAHKFHPDSKKESDEFINKAVAERQTSPDHIRFVTYTTRYNECFWITLDQLEKQYERAEVDATRKGDRVTIQTKNIARFTLKTPSKAVIDGESVALSTSFEKRGAQWGPARSFGELHKRHGLQGPIDDVFMDSFLCVRPPGQFTAQYAKYMRGDLRAKEPAAVSKSDIADKNLVLFGDPTDNKLIAEINGKLPIRWVKDRIVVGADSFPASEYKLAMIYPNPLNRNRYVVLNSGYTFGEAAFKGTNALLYPRLGDWAIIRKSDNQVALAGIFDDDWSLGPLKTVGSFK